MSLNVRSIALRGIGFGPMAMATFGLQVITEQQQKKLELGGGVWPFAHPKSAKFSQKQLSTATAKRTRRTREADLLWIHHL